jgi:hypothetical protein
MSAPRRLLSLTAAYIAASVVAGTILSTWMVWSPGAQIGPVDLDFLKITAFFVSLVSSLVAVLALPAAAAVSWYAERRSKRSAFFYCGAGAMVSLVALGIYVALLIWNDTSAERFSSMGEAAGVAAALAVITSVFVIAGVAGGLTYWAIAGRKAGSHPATPVAS